MWAFFGILLIAIFAAGVFLPAPPPEETPLPGEQTAITLTDPQGTADRRIVDLADAPDEWRRGLQNRPVVERGMLFDFGGEAPRSFWMKDTLVPLDIAFFREDGTWVSSARMEPCTGDPCPSTYSAGAAQYALELPIGDIGPRIGTGWTLTVGSGS